jgi:hypothetical protein
MNAHIRLLHWIGTLLRSCFLTVVGLAMSFLLAALVGLLPEFQILWSAIGEFVVRALLTMIFAAAAMAIVDSAQ